MAKHHPDLIFCRKIPGINIGRLCDKCDGRCVICDSHIIRNISSPVRVCEDCSYGICQNRCLICNAPGTTDAYYCTECTLLEKDRDGCPKILNVGTARTDIFYERKKYGPSNESHTMSNEEVLQKLKNAFSELDNVPDSKILAKLNSEQGEENLEDTRILEMTLAKYRVKKPQITSVLEGAIKRIEEKGDVKNAKQVMEFLLAVKFNTKLDFSSKNKNTTVSKLSEDKKSQGTRYSSNSSIHNMTNPLFPSLSRIQSMLPEQKESLILDFTEFELIRNILSALQGIESLMFRQIAIPQVTHNDSLSATVYLHKVRPEHRIMIEEILKTAKYYIKISTLLRFQVLDTIGQALLKSVRQCINVYFEEASNMYYKFMEDNSCINLFLIYKFTLKWKEPLYILFTLMSKTINKCGLDILNIAYETSRFRPKDTLTGEFLSKIVDAMFAEFHSTLKFWLFRGQVPEGVNHWIISKNDDVSENRKWTDWVVLNKDKLPVSLLPISDIFYKILSIGRTVLFLMESSSSLSYDSQEEQRVELFNRLDPSLSYYDLGHRSLLSGTIYEMNRLVSADMVHTILNTHHFQDHLEALRRHFLLTCPSYFENIHDSFEELNNTFCDFSSDNSLPFLSQRVHLHTLSVDEAIRISNSWRGLRIEKYFIMKSAEGEFGASSHTHSSGSSSLGHNSYYNRKVNLTYRAPQPVGIILNDKNVALYEKIFNMVFEIRGVALKIDRIHTKLRSVVLSLRINCKEMLPLMYKFLGKIHIMSLFINKVLYYIYYDVIPLAQKKLEEDLANVNGLEDIMQYHFMYLETIKKGLFMSRRSFSVSAAISNCIGKISDFLVLSQKLIDFWYNYEKVLTPDPTFKHPANDTVVFEAEEYQSRKLSVIETFENTNKKEFFNISIQFNKFMEDVIQYATEDVSNNFMPLKKHFLVLIEVF
ncbi:PHF5-like family and Gamma-tubulin complex component protein family-containing protein [Strongyloides ratti]|uniref:PHF5-like family and Gamma-tubulin complex component protein family-containing protein n=1 Tax=Strongyloides ratti TaxID=34506 RepID=A0A090L8I4_STRRB|nr:PHF5-like family and Gamma-tubulin complex component protein family-containing protein [Strongyloides ratti]CEF64443.1 PHF5-like family and Gamma-tubulin complex component protein family-containing protein [Strongyloides ratti]